MAGTKDRRELSLLSLFLHLGSVGGAVCGSRAAFVVFAAVCDAHRTRGAANISALAMSTDVSRQTVRRHLAELVRMQLVRTVPRDGELHFVPAARGLAAARTIVARSERY